MWPHVQMDVVKTSMNTNSLHLGRNRRSHNTTQHGILHKGGEGCVATMPAGGRMEGDIGVPGGEVGGEAEEAAEERVENHIG